MKRTEYVSKSASRVTGFKERIIEQLSAEKLILKILILFSSSVIDKSYKCVE